MFYDNYVQLCNSIGKTPTAVALEVGISRSIVSRWKRGGGATDATAHKIAEYFNVPVSELTGEAQQKKPAPENWDGLTDTQRKALELVKTLDDDDLRRLLRVFEAYRQEG